MATKKKEAAVVIPQLTVEVIELKLVGTSPLITHAWSEKAVRMMLDKQMKKAKGGKEAKVPAQDFVDALYWLSDRPPTLGTDPDKAMEAAIEAVSIARFGLKAVAFKLCAVSGAGFVDGITKVNTRGAFHVMGELVEIEASPPVMREDMVRVGMGTADIRFRPMFEEWSATLTVELNTSAMSVEQMLNLFNTGGFSTGVGEWRPEKNGSYGRFTVA